MYSRYVENDFGGTNNVKQEEYKPTFSDIVDLVRDEWNSYSKDGDIGYAKAAALVDKAIEPQVNQQVIQALESIGEPTINDVFPTKPYDGTNTHKDMVSVVRWYSERIRTLIKEYKGDKG